MNENEKFKKLLEYFVAHLEFCVTDQKVSESYTRYIKKYQEFQQKWTRTQRTENSESK